MQDNVNQNMFDKAFVNASWVDMKEMLDKDIPVEVKPVNKTIVVLSTLLLLALMTIGYMFHIQSSSTPTAELTKERYIYKNIYINNPQHSDSKSITNQKTISKEYKQFNLSTTQTHSFDIENHEIKVSNFDPIIFQDNQSIIDDNNIAIQNLPILEAIDYSLVNESFGKIEFNQNPVNESKENINPNKVKYNLGLLSFISSNSNFSGYGFTTGVHLPLTKKIGIQTGLAVNFVSRNYLMFPFLPKNISNLKNYSPLDEEETYYDGLRSFKQIYLPVNLSYAITNVFSINSGFKFRYTYSQELDNLLETRASKTISNSQTVENTFFNNSNIGLSLGVNYQVSRNVNFILDSEWGMNSIINQSQFKQPNSNKYDLNLINLTTSISF